LWLREFEREKSLWEAAIVRNLLTQVKNSRAEDYKREQAMGITEEGSWHAK